MIHERYFKDVPVDSGDLVAGSGYGINVKGMPQIDGITDRVKNLIAGQFAIDLDRLSESARLYEDLGLDSLDSVELVMALEVEFDGEVPDKDISQIKTVGDVIRAVNTYFARPDSAA